MPDAQNLVYGHGNGALKSSFYDVFVTTSLSLFTVRDRQSHTRKRKIISNSFSQKSVLEFQPYVCRYVAQLLGQWEKLYDKALKGMSGKEGDGWKGRDGKLWLDCFPCKRTFSRSASLVYHCYLQGQTMLHSILSVTLPLGLHSG